jgi:hypothetical protein
MAWITRGRESGPLLACIVIVLCFLGGTSYRRAKEKDEVGIYSARGLLVAGVVGLSLLGTFAFTAFMDATGAQQVVVLAVIGSIVLGFDLLITHMASEPTFLRRLFVTAPRVLLLSIPLGLVVAGCLHLVVFRASTSAEIATMNSGKLDAQAQVVRTESDEATQIAQLGQDVTDAQDRLTKATAAANEASATYAREVGDANGRPGAGPIADNINATVVIPAQQELDAARTALTAAEQARDTQTPGLESRLEDKIRALGETYDADDDFATRLEALDQSLANRPAARTWSTYLMWAVIGLDLSVAAAKVLLPPTQVESEKRKKNDLAAAEAASAGIELDRARSERRARRKAARGPEVAAVYAAAEVEEARRRVAANGSAATVTEEPTGGDDIEPDRPSEKVSPLDARRRAAGLAGVGALMVVGILAGSVVAAQSHDTPAAAAWEQKFTPEPISYTGSDACEELSTSKAIAEASGAAAALVDPANADALAVFDQAAHDLEGVAEAAGDLRAAAPAAAAIRQMVAAPGQGQAMLDVRDAMDVLAEEVSTRCVAS